MELAKLTADERADVALEIAAWWRGLKTTTNRKFFDLYFDQHRYLVLMGGAGSGKSIFAGRKIIERATSVPGHRILVCRKVARTLRQSCFEQIIGQVHEYYPDAGAKINQTDMRITFANGSMILFAGLDDVEKLKSIYDITSIWIEEASEVEQTDFQQLDIRLRGRVVEYQQILITFNPISVNHWLKKRFFDTKDEKVLTSTSTYKDNRFLPQENRETLERFKYTDPYYYDVYCLGRWGVVGKTVFAAQLVQARIDALETLPQPGTFALDIVWRSERLHDRISGWALRTDEDGDVRIWKQPEKGRPYVIGADTAGEGSDFNVAQVLDNITGEQVAVLRREMDEDVFAWELYCLGKLYNDALLAVEINYSTHPEKELERLGYKRLFVRERIDSYTGKNVEAFGFKTDGISRPLIIGELVGIVREHTALFNDPLTLDEMLTFVRNEKGRPEAALNAHDDCVMAIAIAHHARSQQRMTVTAEAEERRRWTEDQWEDYNHASAEERAMLIKLWGRPETGG